MKRLLFWISMIFAVLLVMGIAGALFADTIATHALNRFGHSALNVETRIGTCRVSLLRGTLTLEGIELKNPVGFKSPRLAYLDHILISLEPSSVFREVLQVRSIEIGGLDLTYEAAGFGRSNLSVFIDDLRGNLRGGNISLGDSGSSKAKKIVIDHFLVEGGRISLSEVTSPGRGIILTLPPMVIHDIGKDRQTSVSEAVSEVLRRLGNSALTAAGGGSIIL